MKSIPADSAAIDSAIRRVLNGDKEAYEIIYAVTNPKLRSFIAQNYGHYGEAFVHEAATVTHEYALARLGEYDRNRSELQTWLCWLARAAVRDLIRQQYGSRYSPFSADWLEALAAPGPSPADRVELDRRSRVLREELEHLPEDQRRVIELHYLEGQTLHRVAGRLRLRYSGVVRRRTQALKRLRERLLERDVRIVERDTTSVQKFYDGDRGGYDEDDWTAPTAAYLPDYPGPLVGRAGRREDAARR